MTSTVDEPKPKYKYVAPEGGWGYMIGLGMALAFIVALCPLPCFGLMFGDFLESLGEKTSALTLLNSAFFSSLAFSGLMTNSLFQKFSCRQVGLTGGSLFFLGSFLTVFVTSVSQLLFTFSLIQGVGFGLMIPAAFTTFNAYFVERRTMVMSASQTLIGVGAMLYPLLVQSLIDHYGFRGMLGVMAAVNAHAILGMIMMQPVELHRRKVLADVEMAEIDTTTKLLNEETSNNPKVQDEPNGRRQSKDDPPQGRRGSRQLSIVNKLPLLLNEQNKRKDSVDGATPIRMLQKEEQLARRRGSSICSLGNWTGAVIVSDSVVPVDKKSRGKLQVIVDFLDLTLLKDWVYVNMIIGVTFALYSDIAFSAIQTMYLFTLGWSKSDTAICVSAAAAADLFSRTFLAVGSACIKVRSRLVFLAGALFSVFARIVFLYVTDFTMMLIISCFVGFFRTWIHVPLPLVFAEYFSQERFPSAYGLFMFMQGLMTLALGPIVGFIRDVTHSYIICFHALTVCLLICCVPWIAEMVWLKCKRK